MLTNCEYSFIDRFISKFALKYPIIGMRVNMNETKVMVSAEWQKVMQKAVRRP